VPYVIERVERTPNPSAMKLIVSPPPGRIVSWRAPEPPPDDPLVVALSRSADISGVLVHSAFITVNLAPGTSWDSVRREVEAALSDGGGGESGG